jgi:hypothetical protein
MAPACVRQIAADNVICLHLSDTQAGSDIELAYLTGEDRAIVATFAAIARESFRTTRRQPRLDRRS